MGAWGGYGRCGAVRADRPRGGVSARRASPYHSNRISYCIRGRKSNRPAAHGAGGIRAGAGPGRASRDTADAPKPRMGDAGGCNAASDCQPHAAPVPAYSGHVLGMFRACPGHVSGLPGACPGLSEDCSATVQKSDSHSPICTSCTKNRPEIIHPVWQYQGGHVAANPSAATHCRQIPLPRAPWHALCLMRSTHPETETTCRSLS